LFTAEQIEDLESKALYGVPKARLSGAAAAAPAESAAIARDVQALNKSIEAQKAENKELRDQLNKVTETLAALVTAQNTAKAKAAPPPPPKPSATSAAE
jgi:uncharacterized coiled-coil protein SlyX